MQNIPWFNEWLVSYADAWGSFLDTPEAFDAGILESFIKDSPRFEVENSMIDGRPNAPSGWLTFNQFFARQTKPGKRPVHPPAELRDAGAELLVCAAALRRVLPGVAEVLEDVARSRVSFGVVPLGVFRDELREPGRVYCVAVVDGRIVGYGGLMIVVDDAHVIVREGKFWLYYKGGDIKVTADTTEWGLAIGSFAWALLGLALGLPERVDDAGVAGGRVTPADPPLLGGRLDVPDGRTGHTAVWTGTEMIVWGGSAGSITATGGRYDPASDSWNATSTSGVPSSRWFHTAVWTGEAMIVWGGEGRGDLRTGGLFVVVGAGDEDGGKGDSSADVIGISIDIDANGAGESIGSSANDLDIDVFYNAAVHAMGGRLLLFRFVALRDACRWNNKSLSAGHGPLQEISSVHVAPVIRRGRLDCPSSPALAPLRGRRAPLAFIEGEKGASLG